MKKVNIFLPLILMAVSGCSRPQLKEEKAAFFKDDKVPFRIEFVEGAKMKVEEDYDGNGFDLDVDLSNEFSNDLDPGIGKFVLRLDFFDGPEGKQDFITSLLPCKLCPDAPPDAIIGNIPAIQYGKVAYVLLTPKVYATAVFVALGERRRALERDGRLFLPEAFYDRLESITKEMMKRIYWEKPIDQNSQEFKDWKAHILSLIEEARKSSGESNAEK